MQTEKCPVQMILCKLHYRIFRTITRTFSLPKREGKCACMLCCECWGLTIFPEFSRPGNMVRPQETRTRPLHNTHAHFPSLFGREKVRVMERKIRYLKACVPFYSWFLKAPHRHNPTQLPPRSSQAGQEGNNPSPRHPSNCGILPRPYRPWQTDRSKALWRQWLRAPSHPIFCYASS